MADDGQGGYLVVEKDGTKHLPTRTGGSPDHHLMGAAWAALHGGYRGNKYEGPGKQEAISKLTALYKSEGMDTPDQASELLSFTIALGEIAAAGLVKLPLAITGSWVHPASKRKVEVSLDDLEQVRENFSKKANGEINVDYDHACTIPNFTGGPRPSAGRVLSVNAPEPFTDRKGIERHILWGQYEPTEMARELIAKREYRYISPVLERERVSKIDGESQGMTMTSIALTNTPVMEEMPEITLSETGQKILGVDRIQSERLIECSRVAGKGETEMATHSLKFSNADGLPHHEIHAKEGGKIGEIDHGEFCHYAAAHAGQRFSEESLGELLTAVGAPNLATLEQLRERLTLAGQFDAQKKTGETRALILKDCLSDQGVFNEDALDRLIEQGKVEFADTVPVKRAVRMVNENFAAGKLTPAQRKAAIHIACSDADAAKAFFKDVKAFVPLEPRGASRTGTGSGTDDLAKMAETRAAEKKIPYEAALSEVSRENRDLAEQARQATIADRQGQ
jgi:hypothetical protein